MVERCAAAPWSPLPVRFGPRQAGVRTDETASLLAPVRDCCAVSTPTSAGRSSGSREGSGTMNVALRGSSIARRGVGLGTAASPGTRASGGARPTGGAFSVEASSDEGPSWVEHRSTRRRLGHCGESRNAGVGRSPTHGGVLSVAASSGEGPSWVEHRSTRRRLGHCGESRTAGVGRSPTHGGVFSANASDGEDLRGSSNSSTRRWLGHCGESRNAGVGRSPTHGGCFQRRGIQRRRSFVGRASLDAASAWALRRVQDRGRRAEPDPRGVLSGSRHPVARTFVGRAIARRGDGLGTAASPGTRASDPVYSTVTLFARFLGLCLRPLRLTSPRFTSRS